MKRVWICGALAAGCSLPVLAQPARVSNVEQVKAQLNERFARADANADGKLTKDEAKGKMPRVHQHFDSIDAQKKGYVTKEEILAYGQTQAQNKKAGT
jgi:EF hand